MSRERADDDRGKDGSDAHRGGHASARRLPEDNVREYGMLLSLIAIMAFFQYMTNGTLLKPLNLTNLVLQNSYIVIMALGMLLVIVAGHIDLSVGSVCGFIGALAAVLMVRYDWNFVPASLAVPGRRRRDRRRAGLVRRVPAHPVVHRHARRHARVQGARARAAAGRVRRALPDDLPAPQLGLHPRCLRRCRAAHQLDRAGRDRRGRAFA
jgi:hypothetical protein